MLQPLHIEKLIGGWGDLHVVAFHVKSGDGAIAECKWLLCSSVQFRNNRRPRDEYEIFAHDQKVYRNWLKLKEALQVDGGPIDPKYR